MLDKRDKQLIKWGFCEGREFTMVKKGKDHGEALIRHLPIAEQFINNISLKDEEAFIFYEDKNSA